MPFAIRERFLWRLRSRSLPLGESTRIMAIINLTPDSFSGDGTFTVADDAAAHKLGIAAAVEAVDLGADIIDLGAESTRPNAEPLSAEEECERLLPVLEGLRAARPGAIVSVDTYHAATARAALKAGAEIINDVSGMTWDVEMPRVIAASGCGLVMMHTRGRPGEWSAQPRLEPGLVLQTVFAGLMEQLALAEAEGVASERVVLDPGFGFGKRGAAENFPLLAGLSRLCELGRPLLVGVSRKGFLGEAVAAVQPKPPADITAARHLATVAAHTAAILAGTHILRVHNVQAAREAAAVADAILDARVESAMAAVPTH